MMRKPAWILVLLVIAVMACSENDGRFHVVRKKWQGGEILEYYKYADSDRTIASASIEKQQFVSLDEVFEFPDVLVNSAFLDHGEVYIVVDNNFGRFLTRLVIGGRLEYVLDATALRYSVISGVSVERLPGKQEVRFTISYLTDEGEAEWGRTVQVASFVDVEPYRF